MEDDVYTSVESVEVERWRVFLKMKTIWGWYTCARDYNIDKYILSNTHSETAGTTTTKETKGI